MQGLQTVEPALQAADSNMKSLRIVYFTPWVTSSPPSLSVEKCFLLGVQKRVAPPSNGSSGFSSERALILQPWALRGDLLHLLH